MATHKFASIMLTKDDTNDDPDQLANMVLKIIKATRPCSGGDDCKPEPRAPKESKAKVAKSWVTKGKHEDYDIDKVLAELGESREKPVKSTKKEGKKAKTKAKRKSDINRNDLKAEDSKVEESKCEDFKVENSNVQNSEANV